ncbi:MAG: nuclear transport factor 2 family protein [Acidobacteriaceae bacterium]|nr:nuclear transport factor 2 family protein [Acidobacteriaceae bacterium]
MEKNVPNTPLGQLYKEHIALILKKDIEAILDQYTPDALLISSFSDDRKPRYYRGRAELREHFQGILALKGLEVEIAFWGEDDYRALMIVEDVKATTAEGTATMRFADSWVLQDGKISIHFAGMVQYPDGSIA